MKRKQEEDEPIKTDRWLMTYSDMMNNLLVLFMVLYAMSVLDLQKFQHLAKVMSQNLSGGSAQTTQVTKGNITTSSDIKLSSIPSRMEAETQNNDFDKVYRKIEKKIKESGYSGSIVVEKGKDYIKFRFKDTVLFYPNSPEMKESSFSILKYMGDILSSIDSNIQTIEIGGHTADTGSSETDFAWQLSSDRAIAVLEFFSNNCKLPQSKMTVSGYSHYEPVASNSTEEGKAMNRRVEVKITRVTK